MESSIPYVRESGGGVPWVLCFRCKDCNKEGAGRSARCPNCGGSDLVESEVPGQGTVMSRTTVHRTHNWWPGPSPYDLAEVQLQGTDIHMTAAVAQGVRVEFGDMVDMTLVHYLFSEQEITVFHWQPSMADAS